MAFVIPIAISLAVSAATAGIQALITRKKKPNPVDRGRNDDVRIMGSDYGSVIPKIYGKVRLAPQLIYSTGIRAVVTETQERTSGGKGGGRPAQTVRNYNYYTTIALAPCLGEIEDIPKIWANTDVLYSRTPDPNLHFYEAEDGTLAGGATSTADAGCSSGFKVTGIGSGGTLEFADLPTPIVPTDESASIYTVLTVYYKSATDKTLYLSVDGGTPEAHLCPATGSSVNTKTIYIDAVHPESVKFSNAGASTVDIDRISIWYSYLTIYPEDPPVTGVRDEFIDYPIERGFPNSYYNYQPVRNNSTGIYTFQTVNTQGIRIYTGTQTQTQDSAIVAHLDTRYGAGNGVDYCSAYRGTAYVVLEDYLVPNGNLPNFTMEVNQGMTAVDEIIEDLHSLKGIDSSYLDLTALSGLEISGIIINSLQSPEQTINQLESWFNFKMIEMDGKRKAVLLNQSPIATITSDDLRAHEYGEDMPDFDNELTIISEESLPREYYVGCLNPNDDLEYKNESQRAAYFASTLAQDTISESYPFVAQPIEAQEVAERRLRKSHLAGKVHKFTAMPEFIRYAPGDVIELELENATHTVEILKKQAAIFGQVQFDAIDSSEVLITSNVNTSTANKDLLKDGAKFPSNSELFVFESVPVELTHEGLGIYCAVSRNGWGKWQGSAIYKRIGEDTDWNYTQSIETQAMLGDAQDVLGDHTTTSIDTTNSLIIYFYENTTLETYTADEILANPLLNLIRVGDEWLQFRTATAETLPSGSVYRSAYEISNLTRGTFNTSAFRATHTENEQCVVYSSAVKFVALDSTYFEQDAEFTAVTFGQNIDIAETKTLTIGGLSTGGQAPTDLNDRINATPLSLVVETAATNTAVSIRVSGYSESSRFRRISVSSNSDMSSATILPIVDANDTGGTLNAVFEFTKTGEASAVHRYFLVEQSVNGMDYRQVSNILDVTFASSGGSGGSGTLTKPVITLGIASEDDSTATIELTITTAGSGTGNYTIERSANSGVSWSVIATNQTSPYSSSVTKANFGKFWTYRVIRDNASSLYSDAETIYVEPQTV